MKEETKDEDEFEFTDEFAQSPHRSSTSSSASSNKPEKLTTDTAPIGIRPRPVKPGNPATCKSGAGSSIDADKKTWAPGAWQDGTRTSAFQPYKVSSSSCCWGNFMFG